MSGVGKGHVTDAVRLLTGLAFEQLGANRVFIRCAERNEKSAAVARRAGFQFEGRQRNGIKDAHDNLHDVLCFSMIPEEWGIDQGDRPKVVSNCAVSMEI